MKEEGYNPVKHDHEAWIREARKRPGFQAAYDALEPKYELIRARMRAKMTQQAVAEKMGTTKSAISRLEGGRRSPTISTLEKYAAAIGYKVEIKLKPVRKRKAS